MHGRIRTHRTHARARRCGDPRDRRRADGRREDPACRPSARRHRLEAGRLPLLLPSRDMPDFEPAGEHGALARPQVKAGADGKRRSLDLVVSLAALALGAPGCAGLALGMPLSDWPVPFHPQLDGEIALKTVVYLSGFLAAYGAIGLVWLLAGGEEDEGPLAVPPFSRSRREGPDPGAGDAGHDT